MSSPEPQDERLASREKAAASTRMHFFDLNALRSELQADSGDDALAWPYLFGTLGLMALSEMLAAFQPPRSTETIERIGAVLGFAATIGGLAYTYRCNGGPSGRNFVNRSFALSWVIACRVLRWLVPLLIIAGLILSPRDVEIMTHWAGLGWLPFSVWIYARTGRELRRLSGGA